MPEASSLLALKAAVYTYAAAVTTLRAIFKAMVFIAVQVRPVRHQQAILLQEAINRRLLAFSAAATQEAVAAMVVFSKAFLETKPINKAHFLRIRKHLQILRLREGMMGQMATNNSNKIKVELKNRKHQQEQTPAEEVVLELSTPPAVKWMVSTIATMGTT